MMAEERNPRIATYSDAIANSLIGALQNKIKLVSLNLSVDDSRAVMQAAIAKVAAEAAIGCVALASADHQRIYDEAAEAIATALVARRSEVAGVADLQRAVFKIFGVDLTA